LGEKGGILINTANREDTNSCIRSPETHENPQNQNVTHVYIHNSQNVTHYVNVEKKCYSRIYRCVTNCYSQNVTHVGGRGGG